MEPRIPEEGDSNRPCTALPVPMSAAPTAVWEGGSAPTCYAAMGRLLLVRVVASVVATPLTAVAAVAAALEVLHVSAGPRFSRLLFRWWFGQGVRTLYAFPCLVYGH